jgi:hypothetical protein
MPKIKTNLVMALLRVIGSGLDMVSKKVMVVGVVLPPFFNNTIFVRNFYNKERKYLRTKYYLGHNRYKKIDVRIHNGV